MQRGQLSEISCFAMTLETLLPHLVVVCENQLQGLEEKAVTTKFRSTLIRPELAEEPAGKSPVLRLTWLWKTVSPV